MILHRKVFSYTLYIYIFLHCITTLSVKFHQCLCVWLAPLANHVRQARNLRNFSPNPLPRCQRPVSEPSFLHVLNVSSGWSLCWDVGNLAAWHFSLQWGKLKQGNKHWRWKELRWWYATKRLDIEFTTYWTIWMIKKTHDTYVHLLLKLVLTPWDGCNIL